MKKNHLAWALSLFGIGALGLIFLSGPATGQVAVQIKGGAVKGGPAKAKGPVIPDGSPPAAQFSAIKFHENENFRKYLNVARECIKDKEWQQGTTALQLILDAKEDSYAQVTEVDPSGKKIPRWISVKFEANNLLGSMPEEGLDVYEQRFGAPAKNKLQAAKANSDRELLAEVAQRYLHTKAGIEANDLLATYFMDRGQFFMAALRFEKMFAMNPERVKVDDLTLFKAALSYRRAGDTKNADSLWRKLEARMRDLGGLKIGGEVVATSKLRDIMEETPRPESSSPYDWPYVRGNETNSAQARGSPPLLDVTLFHRDLINEKSADGDDEEAPVAKAQLDNAIHKQASLVNTPVLPGSFPIAANNLLIYRSYYDVRAVYIQDEKNSKGEIEPAGSIAWKSIPLDGALAKVLQTNNLAPTLGGWLTGFYDPAGFNHLIYENTLNGTLSTDHQNVYAIDDLSIPAPSSHFQSHIWNNPSQVGQEVKPLVLQNTLNAFKLRTGNLIWQLGPGNKGTKDDPFAESHFLGAPISVGGKLYVLNEKNTGPMGDGELRLVCIDPNKMESKSKPTVIEPIQSLGSVTLQSRITHDPTRRLYAVHLGYGEGILVCPTNAGEVLGVDILSRSLAWAYPYRDQMPQNVPFAMNQAQILRGGFGGIVQNVGTTSVANWHSAPPVIQDGKVVFTAPDANSVHCINLRDGTPVWKKKQSENDLYLAGVFDGKVLIVGKSAVRALSLQDGRQLWYLSTGDLPSGQGVASQNIYYLPLKKGEIMAIDIEKGQIKAHNRAKTGNFSPGNLVFYEGTVISQTPTQIVAYPQLVSRLQMAQAGVQADPNNPLKLVERGELYIADGQVQKAVDDLEKALTKKPEEPLQKRARLKLYEALTDLLNLDFVGAGSRYLDEYRELCQVPDNPKEQQQRQARYFRIVGQGREAQGNLVQAFQMYREFGSLPIHREQGGIASMDDPSHKVPTNVWLRGRVSAMIAKATPEQRAPLEEKINEEWKTVQAKKDIDAIRSFVGMFDVPFNVGRQARLQLAELIIENNDRPNFLEAELNLLQLRGAEFKDDPNTGGRALADLALLEEKKGSALSMKLAAAYYRQLHREFAAAPVRQDKDGMRTGADIFNELATDPRFRPFLEEPGSPWGQEKLAAREMATGAAGLTFQGFIFQPEGDPTPVMRHYRLMLDPENNNGFRNPQLRLLDLTNNTVRWSQGLGLVQANQYFYQFLYQQSQPNTAYNPNAKFRFYQVKGNLVVFQVGTMVYCLDVENAKILWQQSLLDVNNGSLIPSQGMNVMAIMPDRDGYLDLVLRNQLGQTSQVPVGHVAAVEASYVALVTQKGLLVLDPLRGTLLWKKMDVSAHTRVFGDENNVYVVETSEGSAGSGRALRASDGVEIAAPDFGAIYQNRVKILGRRILTSVPGRENLVLKLYDIPTGKDVWSKPFDPKSVVVRTEDPKLTGVVDPAGKLIVLETDTGREIMNASTVHGRVSLDDLKDLKDPLLLRDAEHFYLALNKPIDSAKVGNGGILYHNFNNGLRCMSVNGWLLAFHRQAGERKVGATNVSWKAGDLHWHSYTPLYNQLIVLEQFEDLPVLMFSSRYMELLPGGGNRWVSFTQSIDKRSGKMIYDLGPKSVGYAIQFQRLNVDLKNGTINMIGLNGNTIQHYIDDGRKPADVPGVSVGSKTAPQGTPTTADLELEVRRAILQQRIQGFQPPPPPLPAVPVPAAR